MAKAALHLLGLLGGRPCVPPLVDATDEEQASRAASRPGGGGGFDL